MNSQGAVCIPVIFSITESFQKNSETYTVNIHPVSLGEERMEIEAETMTKKLEDLPNFWRLP